MAVGGLADTAHGSAGLHIDGPYHQHAETGDKILSHCISNYDMSVNRI